MTRRPGSLSKIRTLARKLAKDEDAERQHRAQARQLARKGRGGDSEIAHVTPGEIVIPLELQTPEVMAALDWAAADAGLSLDRLRVGARGNSINPKTGAPEFRVDDDYKYWQDQPPTPMPEIVVRGGLGQSGLPGAMSNRGVGGMGGAIPGRGETGGGGASSLLPPVPMEEIVVTGHPPRPRPLLDRQRNFFDNMQGQAARIAQQHNLNEDHILGLSAYESGWWTHAPSIKNNNPFGINNPGTNTLRKFDSVEDAFDYWGKVFGPRLTNAQNAREFRERLRNGRVGAYNSENSAYDSVLTDVIDSVRAAKPIWQQRRTGP